MSSCGPLTGTYRLQLHKEFPLESARRLVPYLERLGISHLYSSPILKSRPGSTHGYDVADPTTVDPELGGDDDRRRSCRYCTGRAWDFCSTSCPITWGSARQIPTGKMCSPGAADPDTPHGSTSIGIRRTRSTRADWCCRCWGTDGRTCFGVESSPCPAGSGRYRLVYFDNSWPLDPTTVGPIEDWVRQGRPLKTFSEGREGERRMSRLLQAQHYNLVMWRRAARDQLSPVLRHQ